MLSIDPIVLLVSLALGLLFVNFLRKRMLSFGIAGIDINKKEKPRIPEAGGMLLLPGIWILVLTLTQFEVINPIAYLFLFTITCFAAIGFFDDGFRLFKKETGWHKYVINRALVMFLFTLPFAYLIFPSLVTCPFANVAIMAVFGGLLILLTSSLTNTFAGLNGWEIGSSTMILAGLTIMASYSPIYTSTLTMLGAIMVGASFALLWFNRYPARIFPGDSGTLLLGSFMGCMILFIDHWYIALGLFAPHIYDIVLKLRTNSRDLSQKNEKPYVLKDDKLEIPKSGKMDFAKLILKYKGPMTEKQLSRTILKIVANNTLFWTLLYILIKII